MRAYPLSAAVSLLSIAIAAPAGAILFDDGLLHRIDAADSFPSEGVIVRDGPGGATTTVQVLAGGQVGTSVSEGLDAFENSAVIVSGDTVFDLFALDAARIEITGGEIQSGVGNGTNCVGICSPAMEISGGVLHGTLSSSRNGSLTISGGEMLRSVRVEGFSVLTLSGGAIFGSASLPALQVSGNGVATVAGGAFHGDIRGDSGARLRISGGELDGDLFAQGISSMTIAGSSFNRPLGELSETEGSLSGILADGTPFSVDFARGATATITLVPEPSSALLLVAGLAGLGAIRKRSQSDPH